MREKLLPKLDPRRALLKVTLFVAVVCGITFYQNGLPFSGDGSEGVVRIA